MVYYNIHRETHLLYLIENLGGDLVADYFVTGIFIMMLFGLFGYISFKAYLLRNKLKNAGYKPPKSLFEEAMDVAEDQFIKLRKGKKDGRKTDISNRNPVDDKK